jgi:hypothetical protein
MSEPRSHPSLPQSALSLLRRARAPINPQANPLVQLMSWGLEDNRAKLHPELLGSLGEALEEMAGWEDAQVERYLLRPVPDDPEVGDHLSPDALERLNPSQGARLLLSQLHDQLGSVSPDYPPPSNLRSAFPAD